MFTEYLKSLTTIFIFSIVIAKLKYSCILHVLLAFRCKYFKYNIFYEYSDAKVITYYNFKMFYEKVSSTESERYPTKTIRVGIVSDRFCI